MSVANSDYAWCLIPKARQNYVTKWWNTVYNHSTIGLYSYGIWLPTSAQAASQKLLGMGVQGVGVLGSCFWFWENSPFAPCVFTPCTWFQSPSGYLSIPIWNVFWLWSIESIVAQFYFILILIYHEVIASNHDILDLKVSYLGPMRVKHSNISLLFVKHGCMILIYAILSWFAFIMKYCQVPTMTH